MDAKPYPIRTVQSLARHHNINAKTLILACLVIYLCFFLSFYLNVISVAILFFVIGLVLILDDKSLFCLLIFLFPFAPVFKISGISTSLFTIVEFIALIKLFVTNKKIKASFFIFIFGYIFLCCITINGIGGALEIAKIILAFSLVYFFAQNYKEEDFKLFFTFYLLAIFTSTAMGLFRGVIPRLTELTGVASATYIGNYNEGTLTTSIRFSGLNHDPNYYSAMLLPAVVVTFQSLFLDKKNKRIINIILFGIISLLGFLTLSKSFILVYAVIVGLIMLTQIKKRPFLVLFLILLIAGVIIIDPLGVFSKLLLRFDDVHGVRDLNTLTTGRLNIWKMYISEITKSKFRMFFGYGIDADYVNGTATHNLYIEGIYKLGIIGLVLFAAYYTVIFVSHRKKGHTRLVNILPLICILAMHFFLAGFVGYELPIYLMISFAYFRYSVS